MELTFETILSFNDGLKTFFSHEPDNIFTEFYVKDNRIANRSSAPVLGYFDDLSFKKEARKITSQPVKDFAVKTFPHFGSYCFYTPMHTPTSIMVVPINKESSLAAKPQVVVTDTGTTIHLDITGDYECFRIEVRLDYFATEFVTYSKTFDFLPMYTGNCTITVTGHSNEISITSEPFEYEIVLVDRTI